MHFLLIEHTEAMRSSISSSVYRNWMQMFILICEAALKSVLEYHYITHGYNTYYNYYGTILNDGIEFL